MLCAIEIKDFFLECFLAFFSSLGICGYIVLLYRRNKIVTRELESAREENKTLIKETHHFIQENAMLFERCEHLQKLDKDIEEKARELQKMQREQSMLEARLAEVIARADEEKKGYQEKTLFLTKAQESLLVAFKAASVDTLKETQKTFLDVAKQTFEKYEQGVQKELQHRHGAIQELVKPLRESLEKVDSKIHEIEKIRASAYAGVTEQLRSLALTHGELQKETRKLVQAFHAPSARGAWGELQLKRVVEMAGMLEYCDFTEQHTLEGETRKIRPDMIVRLPNSRSIIIDAKAPLKAYLEAVELHDGEERRKKFVEHAKQLRKHVAELSDKAYWDSLQPTPEFVILFLPGEAFFSVALEHDPTLVEVGVEKKVLLATPTPLIALLKTIAYGWKEEMIAKNAKAISDLGKTLYDRLQGMGEYLLKLKKSLDSAVESYNKTVGCFEGRVLVAARKFPELGVGEEKEISLLEPVEKVCRNPQEVCTVEIE